LSGSGSPLVHSSRSIIMLKSKRKMSEIMSENKLSMLISEPMEASADMGATACNTKASQSILLDAGPLQRV